MKLETKTTAKLLDEFHNVWGKESDFVTKSDYIDKEKYKKWTSNESLKEWLSNNSNPCMNCGSVQCAICSKELLKELEGNDGKP